MLSLSGPFKEKLLDQYRNAPLDLASFFRNYKACGLGECLGMCCNGGSGFYMKEESETIAKLVEENRDWFAAQGAPMPEKIFDEEVDEETGEVELSTNTRETIYPDGYLPPHFPNTSCVFRDPKGACTLQKLGVEKGVGGWAYKPFACWLFPLELEHGGKPFIHVAHHSTDEYVDETYPGFVGYTKCGAECKTGGTPAYKILEGEIKALSDLLERDLMSEIVEYGKQNQLIAA
jgi:hypothetical protein